MDTLPIPLPASRTVTVLVTPAHSGDLLARLLAELALRGRLTVLDGGNRFPAYRLLQHLRLRLPDPASVARQVTIRRAFTCHQVLALLESAPPLPHPTVLLDPLAAFYDENVPLPESSRLLDSALRQVERLRQHAPVLIVLPPPPSSLVSLRLAGTPKGTAPSTSEAIPSRPNCSTPSIPDRITLFDRLCAAANSLHTLELSLPPDLQPALL